MSTTSFLAFALLVVLITLSLSQPGKAIPNSADADPERAAGNAEAHRDISLVRKQLEDVLPINLKRQLAAYNGTYNKTYNGTKRRTHSVASGQEKSVEYIEVTADDGTPFATSIYNEKYHPDKAFKILGASRYTYWCSSVNPQKPVYLGFIFKTPQCVTKIKFLEQYPIPSNSIYQVFASNNKYNCQNPSGLTILASDTADVFAVGKEFENKDLYYCYGLIVHDHSKDGNTELIAVKRLQFGVKAPPEPKILKVFQFDGDSEGTVWSNLNALMEYVSVTSQSGTAYASSEYGTGHKADKAFEGDGYWCSVKSPDTPVRLWFQFKEPKRVVQIKFEEQYEMSGEDGYEVFGSDAVGDCGGPNKQNVLTKAAASEFVTGKEFKNARFFYCYGIQTNSYTNIRWRDYISAKKLKFGFEATNESVSDAENTKTFLYVKQKMNWANARNECQKRGGDLASLTNLEDFQRMKMEIGDDGYGYKIWVGGNFESKKGNIENNVWLTCELIPTSRSGQRGTFNWCPMEPYIDESYRCLTTVIAAVWDGYQPTQTRLEQVDPAPCLAKGLCFESFAFVCEIY